ncbi:MAG: DUF541 domain-containing protein [Bacteroidetes bacterium]|nr:MAG: DUF541 domain-containing protein [Bacteroidota bacterium]
MQKTFFLACFALSLSLHDLCAQAKGNVNYNEANMNRRSKQEYQQNANLNNIGGLTDAGAPVATIMSNDFVDIDASVLFNTKPDHLVAIFNVVQLGETASEVNRIANDRINGFWGELQKMGVKQEQLFIDMVSLIPVYEVEVEKKLFSKNYNEVPKGFELQKNLHISFADERKLNEILTTASQFEIYDIVRVDYIVNDSKKIYAQMQDEAAAVIAGKLERYKKMGINISPNNRTVAENSTIFYPTDRYKSYQAFSSTSLDMKKSANAPKIQQVRKPMSYYYNKVSEATFDAVVNPHVLEPVVQYAYTLKMRCFIERALPAPAKEKEVWILTPAGELKLMPK